MGDVQVPALKGIDVGEPTGNRDSKTCILDFFSEIHRKDSKNHNRIIMMESNSIGYLTNLLNSIKKKRLVLFVGSGISIYPPANLPAGGMVTKLLKIKLQELDCFDRYKNKSNYLHHIWEEPYGPSFEAILELAPDKNKVLKFLRELYFNCNPNNIHLFIAELLRKELIQVVMKKPASGLKTLKEQQERREHIFPLSLT